MNASLSPPVIRQPDARRRAAALDLAHAFLPPAHRRAAAAAIEEMIDRREVDSAGLWAAYRGESLVGAAWGEALPGRTAAAQPPQLRPGEDRETAFLLLSRLEHFFLSRRATLYQVQLAHTAESDRTFLRRLSEWRPDVEICLGPEAEFGGFRAGASEREAELLAATGLRHVGDLLYLAWECGKFREPPPRGLEFEAYRDADRRRLGDLIEQTYHGSLDLPELDGLRSVGDVLEGYRQTGAWRPGCWRIVRSAGRDVGCLLLTEHPPHRQWELLYMGIIPSMRGRGLAAVITRYAQAYVRAASGQALHLAADCRNLPALRTYLRCGLRWRRRRAVFLNPMPQVVSGK